MSGSATWDQSSAHRQRELRVCLHHACALLSQQNQTVDQHLRRHLASVVLQARGAGALGSVGGKAHGASAADACAAVQSDRASSLSHYGADNIDNGSGILRAGVRKRAAVTAEASKREWTRQ